MRGASFLSDRAYAKCGSTTVIRPADAPRAASIMNSSSTRFSWVGATMGWIRKTSRSRQLACSCTSRQSLANRDTRVGRNGTPRCSQMSAANSGWALPLKTAISRTGRSYSCRFGAGTMAGMPYVAAIDQGTTSSRCIVFDGDGGIVAVARREHRQRYPRPGWVEHDAAEIWANVRAVVDEAIDRLRHRRARHHQPARDHRGLGPGHRRARCTTRSSGRTPAPSRSCGTLADRAAEIRRITGLPLATYFAGPKLRWLLDNVDGLRDRAERGEVLFGTVDSWLIWNLTGRHVTDVTNASRTLLMDLRTLDWSPDLLDALGIPAAMLPEIRPSAEVYGTARGGRVDGVPVAGALGDQQAALFGQACFAARRGQVHLRHRQLPAGQHRCHAGRLAARAAHHGRLPGRFDGHRRTRWRARSPSPARWSSGCATTWA